jgi:uncharacterized membrane protein YgcG
MRANVSATKVLACIATYAVVFAIDPSLKLPGTTAAAALGGQGQPAPEQPQPARLTKDQLRQLVAPIALYPDALLAQILAASAYPTQIVEADRLLQENPNLKGAALGAEVDKQDWDPSVKALTQFPSVLANMDKNLSWTSELGDANFNQPEEVMKAVQYLRKKAKEAGKLESTPQQIVTAQDDSIIIQPADPQVVYVPMYDPTLIYGYPLVLWPGLYPWWGVPGPFISFGIGFGIGPFFGFGWGWPAWGCDWGHGRLFFGGGFYGFHSRAFYDRNAYFHGNFRGYVPFARGDRGLRGYAPREGRAFAPFRSARGWGGRTYSPSMRSWGRVSAFGGITHGGDARSFSSRGQFSFGGGMRGGFGGGMRGGGGRR